MPTAAAASLSLDHLARLDIAELISPSVTIKDTKAPFPRLREKATVRLLAAAGRSLSHRVLEQRIPSGEGPQQSIAKLKFIHRTLGYLSISRYVSSSMRIGTALTGASRKGKAVMFFAFVGWAAPCVVHSLKDYTWLLNIFQRINEMNTPQNRTLIDEIVGEFELDLNLEDAELSDALYDSLRLEGEEGRQVEAEGLAILSEGLSQLVQKLVPQEGNLIAAPYNTESTVPEEWLRLYAEKYLDLGPLVKAGRYPCRPLEAFLRSVAVVVPSRADLLIARIRRVHLLNSLASPPMIQGEVDGHISTFDGNELEDNPTAVRSSPRGSVLVEGQSGQTLTRPTSVSSLLSSASDPTLLPQTSRASVDEAREGSSLNYSITEHGSPRLKWGGLMAAMNWVRGSGKAAGIPNPREANGSSYADKVPSLTGRFSAKVIVPPMVPYPVGTDMAEPVSDDSLQGLQHQTVPRLEEGRGNDAAEDTKCDPRWSGRGQLVEESETITDHDVQEDPGATESGDGAISKQQNARAHRRPVNAVNMRCGFESVEELEQALNAKRSSLGLDEEGAGNRIEEKVARSRAISQAGHTAFASELQAKAAEMHRRIESWGSSSPPAPPPAVDAHNIEEIVTRSLVWDGMDPMEARIVAKKVGKRRVAEVLERLASHSEKEPVDTEEVARLRAIESGRGRKQPWGLLKFASHGKSESRRDGFK
ncbi:hypothetical protein FOL47_001623 [Perkinsus chesapeaki]|uniref:Uncharacterized protein n=1 Tax=Perkinsus chesapeaki TaxID=330153 RepID=A0A7J6N3A1_PERCH|nr:hypothetical protein FOL47_001623 [Perkinsus chesapeaki]